MTHTAQPTDAPPARSEQAVILEAWNGVLFEKFCRFEHLLTDGLAVHGREALARRPLLRGSRVLDVGCGFGDTTRFIAEQLGPDGLAVGVDCAGNFVRRAAESARHMGARHADFFTADVQSDDLRGPYQRAFSRFGTMFFTSPGAALRNVRRALVPGGELTMVVWRRKDDNPWLYEAEKRVKTIVPVVSHDATDQVHCGPGPFSMASADLVSDLLLAAGFEAPRFERFDAEICIGRDLQEAVEFAMALGPSGEILRLAGERARQYEPRVRRELGEVLSVFARDDGVWAGSSTWLINARNPG